MDLDYVTAHIFNLSYVTVHLLNLNYHTAHIAPKFRVSSDLGNLEMSGNFDARRKSQGKVKEFCCVKFISANLNVLILKIETVVVNDHLPKYVSTEGFSRGANFV